MSQVARLKDHWYCARFDAAPPLGLLRDVRNEVAADAPVFFQRLPGGAFRLVIPPEGRRLASALSGREGLPVFSTCERPDDEESIDVLFATPRDVARCFPQRAARHASNVVALAEPERGLRSDTPERSTE